MFTKTLIAGSVGLLLAVPAGPALAKGARAQVIDSGNCSAAATWKLKAKERDGGVEVEFEVDSNAADQVWEYTLSGPAGVLSAGTRTTLAPSGSFSVEAAATGAVTDAFVGTATFGDITCDTTVSPVWVQADDNPGDDATEPGDDNGDDGVEPADDNGDENAAGGTCSDGSAAQLVVKRSGKNRIAKLKVDSRHAGEKWEYEITRGGKRVSSGSVKTKGKKAVFSAKVKSKGKGRFAATAKRADGREDCSVDA